MSNAMIAVYNLMVLNDAQKTQKVPDLSLALSHGIVTDFEMTDRQKRILGDVFSQTKERTLFSQEEYRSSSAEELLGKQLLNYFETYGIKQPGLFKLEYEGGNVIPMRFIQGVTREHMISIMRKQAYSNAPLHNLDHFFSYAKDIGATFEINEVKNNELRVRLFDRKKDTFNDGDDAVRWMCFYATGGNSLLIKTKEMESDISSSGIDSKFFERHEKVLSKVFNRHKRLIMAAKNKKTATAINRISKLSKRNHVPLKQSASKTFLRTALLEERDYQDDLSKMTIRDKFKFLNSLSYKKLQTPKDAYVIRNGRIHFTDTAKTYELGSIARVEDQVLKSLKKDLAHLRGKKIILDANVDYGLPISERQALGRLPYGTRVTSSSSRISTGVFWKNSWGASDLDLSASDLNGNRVGWGTWRAYDNKNDISYSGDMTNAQPCAMEFMTSSSCTYALFVNIYSGQNGAKCKVVASSSEKKSNSWADNAYISEDYTLNRGQSCIGFVVDKTFIVYPVGTSNASVSGIGVHPIMKKAVSDIWTLQKLFDTLGISYDKKSKGHKYDIDLRYKSMSWHKFDEMLSSQQNVKLAA